eukprot:CAMPEP_0118647114 /NCGR_PEP_ID=MMETSP0785-20121206/8432_1 /TAXON_ID=91992 /ORGANISM="Bolidomonas pacifica, Strain CCMP 1866" /LENGTH=308 /DNA_ID=CAMNT_0006539183 /DNA_START=164 /DNA_END=1087 /DNA_ORIENTATION=-
MSDLEEEDLYADMADMSAIPLDPSISSAIQDAIAAGERSEDAGKVEMTAALKPEMEKESGNSNRMKSDVSAGEIDEKKQDPFAGMVLDDWLKVMENPLKWYDNPKYSSRLHRDYINHESIRVIATRKQPSKELRTVKITNLPPSVNESLIMQYLNTVHVKVQKMELDMGELSCKVQLGTEEQARDLMEEDIFSSEEIKKTIEASNLKLSLPLSSRPSRESVFPTPSSVSIPIKFNDTVDPPKTLNSLVEPQGQRESDPANLHSVNSDAYMMKHGRGMPSDLSFGNPNCLKRRKFTYLKNSSSVDVEEG